MIQTENKDFSRDLTTKALLNTNIGALAEHKYRIAQAAKIEYLSSELEIVKAKVEKLTSMLEKYKVLDD